MKRFNCGRGYPHHPPTVLYFFTDHKLYSIYYGYIHVYINTYQYVYHLILHNSLLPVSFILSPSLAHPHRRRELVWHRSDFKATAIGVLRFQAHLSLLFSLQSHLFRSFSKRFV